jgi:hypothetical protein
MYTLHTTLDYNNSYKSDIMSYIRSKLRKDIADNQDFNQIFDQIDMVEKLINQINRDFIKINEKYKLLFGLKDISRLFDEPDFKSEILLYIKYKSLEK